MNAQKPPPDFVHQILKGHGIQYFQLSYCAWPEMFGSTSGPRGGIGGQAMTTFTVEAWVCDDGGSTVLVCAGMYAMEDRPFEFFMKAKSGWKSITDAAVEAAGASHV